MKFLLVLLFATYLSKTCLASSLIDELASSIYIQSLSSIGDKFWESKNELAELNNLKFNFLMEGLGTEYNEKNSEKYPKFSSALENFKMKMGWIDFIYDNMFICANATSECFPESTPAKLAESFLSSDQTAKNLVQEVSMFFRAIVKYFDYYVSFAIVSDNVQIVKNF